MKKLALAAFAFLAFAPAAFAQSYNDGVRSQLSPTSLAPVGLYGQANGATSCNTVSETATQDTITITPGPSQYVYVTMLNIHLTTDATGVTQTETISTTGLNSSGGLAPFFDVNTALTTVQGAAPAQTIYFNPPLKSATPGSAVTFVPSATQSAHNYLCMQAAAYLAP